MKLIDPFWRLNACFIKSNDWYTKSLEQLLKMNLLICKLKYTFECAFKFARNWMIWKSIWMELILNWLGKPILASEDTKEALNIFQNYLVEFTFFFKIMKRFQQIWPSFSNFLFSKYFHVFGLFVITISSWVIVMNVSPFCIKKKKKKKGIHQTVLVERQWNIFT